MTRPSPDRRRTASTSSANADRGSAAAFRDDETAAPTGPQILPIYTPAQAAQLLAVRESWLRRRATARQVPCTFLGKHLRFSHADVTAIARDAAQPPGPPPVGERRRRPRPRR